MNVIGVASGLGAGKQGCGLGPQKLKKSSYIKTDLEWVDLLFPKEMPTVFASIEELGKRLSEITRRLVLQKKFFVVFGGDHSCAVGTWSGVASALKGDLGLIWIDAHLDAHTPETSESGNIHGMPAASLLGYGHPGLTQILTCYPKIKPEHLCFIGTRSFEVSERDLIDRLGVRVYDMEEIKQRGLKTVFLEAIARVRQGTVGFGISLDLDAIDPQYAPGTGTPVAEGIHAEELCEVLTNLREDAHLIGMEIVEFDPTRDQNEKTEKLIGEIVQCLRMPK